mgnify:CR=1 FL=1
MLDELFEDKKLPCFHLDFVNNNTVQKELIDYQTLTGSHVHQRISNNMIDNWIHSIIGYFKIRNYAIEPKGAAKGHYLVVRNFEHWQHNKANMDLIHEHFDNEFLKAQIEKKKEENTSPF